MKRIAIPVLISGVVAGMPAMAQSISESMPELAAHTPVLEQSAGIEYISGGAGLEQRDAIVAVQTRFPLRIVLSGKGGEYIVADSLIVRDGSGHAMTISDAGPLVMLNVPPGRYTVEATFQGRTRHTVVHVGRDGRTLNWSLPDVSTSG
jgi:hypothetical protein